MGVKLRPIASLLFATLMVTGCISSNGRTVDDERVVSDYMNLAQGYLQEGLSEQALKPLGRALEIDPNSSAVHNMLGRVYQEQGENKLAEKAFDKALSYDPDASDLHNSYGAFLFSIDRLDDAYYHFKIASEDISSTQRSRIFENMGTVASLQGKDRLAKEHFHRALRLNNNLPTSHLGLAVIYRDSGDLFKAWKHYQLFDGEADQTARSLLLGINLAYANNVLDKANTYAIQLERLYPRSAELKQFRSRFR